MRWILQVGENLRLEIFLSAFRRVAARAAELLPKLAISRIAPDQVYRIRLKEILQRKLPFAECELCGWLRRHRQEWVLGRSGCIVLDLNNQAGNQIEGLVHVGKLIEQLHHAVVILKRVQADPR